MAARPQRQLSTQGRPVPQRHPTGLRVLSSWPRADRQGPNGKGSSGDDVADALGWALLRVEGGGPLGQLRELAAERLEFPDPRIEVGGVALQHVADRGARGLPVVPEGDDLAS
jgi:hypothetical protein